MPRAQPSEICSDEDRPPPPCVGLDVGVEFGEVDVGKADAGGVSKPDGGVGVADTEAGIEAVLKVVLALIIEARTGGQYRSSQIESPTKKSLLPHE